MKKDNDEDSITGNDSDDQLLKDSKKGSEDHYVPPPKPNFERILVPNDIEYFLTVFPMMIKILLVPQSMFLKQIKKSQS